MGQIKVLDGFVELIEPWGHGKEGTKPSYVAGDYSTSDFEVAIIEAARQSTQGNFRGWDKDAKLLEFLYTKKHSTPFEFSGMTIEVQAPIFVFRE